MPEHFTKTTVEAKFWCSKCHEPTMHYVAGGRRGSCQVCIKKLEEEAAARAKLPAAAVQESLF